MAALRLIDALTDFGAPEQPGRGEPAHSHGAPAPAPPEPPGPDIGELIRTELARAEQALEMRLSVEHEAALLTERQRHADEVARIERSLGEQAGLAISHRMAEIERSVGEHASAAVARILCGILGENLLKRSVEGLAQSIAAAIRDNEAIRIEVRAPQSLFEELSKALPGRVANLHHIDGDGFDLSVAIDGTVLETRLSEWSVILTEILE